MPRCFRTLCKAVQVNPMPRCYLALWVHFADFEPCYRWTCERKRKWKQGGERPTGSGRLTCGSAERGATQLLIGPTDCVLAAKPLTKRRRSRPGVLPMHNGIFRLHDCGIGDYDSRVWRMRLAVQKGHLQHVVEQIECHGQLRTGAVCSGALAMFFVALSTLVLSPQGCSGALVLSARMVWRCLLWCCLLRIVWCCLLRSCCTGTRVLCRRAQCAGLKNYYKTVTLSSLFKVNRGF